MLLVLGLALALLLPVAGRLLDRAPLRAAARQVAAAIREAQQAAVTELVPWEVRFGAGSGSFQRYRDGVAYGSPELLPEGIRVAAASFGGNPGVVFAPNGAPGAAGCVAVENAAGDAVGIRVAAVTGRVALVDGGCPP